MERAPGVGSKCLGAWSGVSGGWCAGCVEPYVYVRAGVVTHGQRVGGAAEDGVAGFLRLVGVPWRQDYRRVDCSCSDVVSVAMPCVVDLHGCAGARWYSSRLRSTSLGFLSAAVVWCLWGIGWYGRRRSEDAWASADASVLRNIVAGKEAQRSDCHRGSSSCRLHEVHLGRAGELLIGKWW